MKKGKKNYPKAFSHDEQADFQRLPKSQQFFYRDVIVEYKLGSSRDREEYLTLGRKFNFTHVIKHFEKKYPDREILKVSEA